MNSIVKEDFKTQLNLYKKELFQKYPELLQQVIQHQINSNGKSIRPLLTCYVAQEEEVNQEAMLLAATLVDLVHEATLMHDDVLDDALIRRHQPTSNALFGNKIAILMGDLILSEAIYNASHHNKFNLLKEISTTLTHISLGELLQSQRNYCNDLNQYETIIYLKTGKLIETSIVGGLLDASIDSKRLKMYHELGKLVGLVFQMNDDINDFKPKEKTGKEQFHDIKDRKITLPVILAYNNAQTNDQEQFLHYYQEKEDRYSWEDILEKISYYKGVELSHNKVNELQISINSKMKELELSENLIRYIKSII